MNRLTPIEEGDICCGCGEKILETEHRVCGTTFRAVRIDGHPFCCTNPKCYWKLGINMRKREMTADVDEIQLRHLKRELPDLEGLIDERDPPIYGNNA